MLDIKMIREHRKEVEEKIRKKDPDANLYLIFELDEEIRKLKTKAEELKAERNYLSKKIGELKREGKDTPQMFEKSTGLGDEIQALDLMIRDLENRFTSQLSQIPNIPRDEVLDSQDPKDNVLVKSWKEKRTFDFTPKNHLELNEKLHLFDFTRGAKISGTGWPVYRGIGARLEWALLNYMMDIHIKNGFEQWIVPLLTRPEAMYGAAQLPKFETQLFKLKDEDYPLYLIPTSEVSLNALHLDEILEEEELPKKYFSYTPCFRREAGAAGKQERGLIRVHQFNKVEMFCFTKPEESMDILHMMVASAEEILQGLDLHYRNMLLVTGDMSFASMYTIDVETWLPGQNRYYEVSSISNCGDFQARRSQTRFRRKGGKPEYVHTLNGSGLATSRLMVSLLENNQNPDGSVNIPPVLQSRLGGIQRLEPSEKHKSKGG